MKDECCACGKGLKAKGDVTVAGMLIKLSWEESTPEVAAAVKFNLGKYAPHNPDVTDIEFSFCFECLIRSLMHTADQKFRDKMERLWAKD